MRALDLDADDDLWDQVVELQVAGRDEQFEEQMYRDFRRQRAERVAGVCRLPDGSATPAGDA